MPTHLTLHGKVRGKERLSLSARAITRLAARAFERGVTAERFSGRFHRYLQRRGSRDGSPLTMRIYGEHIFLFGGAAGEPPRLVTVLQVPARYRRTLHHGLRQRN